MPVKRGSDGKVIEDPTKPVHPKGDEPPTDPMSRRGASLFGRAADVRRDTESPRDRWDAPTDPIGKHGKGNETRILRPKRRPASAEQTAMDDPMANPPVGWLVVIRGPGKGRVLTLGNGMNAIGRGPGSRVQMDFGDDGISRANHARLVYEPRQRRYLLTHGDGDNLTYLNGEVVLQPAAIESGAEIQLGDTMLRFQAFCGAAFDWPDVDD